MDASDAIKNGIAVGSVITVITIGILFWNTPIPFLTDKLGWVNIPFSEIVGLIVAGSFGAWCFRRIASMFGK